VYKLVFGPKAFVVVSDPVVVRHILKVGRGGGGRGAGDTRRGRKRSSVESAEDAAGCRLWR
jgi:hypothetical protein